MVQNDLEEWVKDASAKGFTASQLRSHLRTRGYSKETVDEIISKNVSSPKFVSHEHKSIIFVVSVIAVLALVAALFPFGSDAAETRVSANNVDTTVTHHTLQKTDDCAYACCKDATCADNDVNTNDVCMLSGRKDSFCSNQKPVVVSDQRSYHSLDADLFMVIGSKEYVLRKIASSADILTFSIYPTEERLSVSLHETKTVNLDKERSLDVLFEDVANKVPILVLSLSS